MNSSSRRGDLRRRYAIFGLAGLLVLGLVGWIVMGGNGQDESVAAPDVSVLHSLPQKSNEAMKPAHLAAGLVPPTNRWYSGIVFPATPQPVFPLPLSFQPTANGFTMGLPVVKTTANTVFGSYNPAVPVDLGADSYVVSRYDAVSVTLTYSKGQAPVATVTIAEGSPFVSVQMLDDGAMHVPAGFNKQGMNVYASVRGGTTYGLVAQGKTMMLYPVANGSSVQGMAPYAHHAVQSVATVYASTRGSVTTTLTYQTDSGKTLYAALPEQRIASAQQFARTYETIYGKLQLYADTKFTFSTPAKTASDTLEVGHLPASQKQTLIDQLRADAASTSLSKTDSYFGGKELYRAANLYQLALQLGQKDVASTLKAQIVDDLDQWLDPRGSAQRENRYFYYDTTVKGLVAAQPSFGSELFNDHHFHYGYFLYAAAVVAQHDKTFADRNKAMLNLIASDIGAPTVSDYFPQRRMFDPYFGHSWASGNGDFADGNNQESSSEAVNAWNGLALWGKVSGQPALSDEGQWMLSREMAAASAEWLEPSAATEYVHPTVGINWGGKRDYATFFSAEPNAVVGIQLIPMSPIFGVQPPSADRVRKNLAAAVPGGSYDVQFGDYLLMYRAIADKGASLTAAINLDSKYVDDANSKAYMLAWIMTR